MINKFEFEGSTFEQRDSGYCFKDGVRISKSAYEQAAKARAAVVASKIKSSIENEEEEMHKEACNVMVVDGHEYIRDFANGKYYKDGESISKAAFNRAIGIRTDETMNGGEKKEKKAPRRARPKDIAFECEVDGTKLTLTKKQLDFMKQAGPLELGCWSDLMQDTMYRDIASSRRGMVFGAMVSTLREKSLITVEAKSREGSKKKIKWLKFTELGKAVHDAISSAE